MEFGYPRGARTAKMGILALAVIVLGALFMIWVNRSPAKRFGTQANRPDHSLIWVGLFVGLFAYGLGNFVARETVELFSSRRTCASQTLRERI